MSNLLKRVITAVLFAVIGIAAIYFHYYSFLGLVLILNALMLWEFYGLFGSHGNGSSILTIIKVLGGSLIYGVLAGIAIGWIELEATVLIPVVIFIIITTGLHKAHKKPAEAIQVSIMGIIYISLPLGLAALIAFRGGGYEPNLIMGVLLLVWVNDIFAYFIGSRFGKHKLFPRVSPKKTVEGLIGGLMGVAITTWIIVENFEVLIWMDWLILAVIIFVTGTIGDFIESALKRNLNIKDSGTLLPGHGGLLDRFDGLLFALPFIAAYLILL